MASLGTEAVVFMAMVFVAVLMLAASVIVPTVGTEAQASKRMKRRLNTVLESIDPDTARLLRARRMENLSAGERLFDKFPGMSNFRIAVEQSGIDKPAYTIVLYGLTLALIAFFVVYFFVRLPLIALLAGVITFCIPFIYVSYKRSARLAKFEEQLPEALDMMARALQAGHPFHETLKMVGEEMRQPIAGEFSKVFTDINYGLPIKTSFIALLSRVPSISLNTLVTAVLIQHESGGRIAEILEKIASVIRSRFKLQRRVKTLSAEGRMSAWILTLLPFVLAAVVSITSPTYLPMMIKDPLGLNLVYGAFIMIMIGNFWMRKIIRFKF